MPQTGGLATLIKENNAEIKSQYYRQLEGGAFVSGGTEFSGRTVTLF
ncbi:MAG TPA: hypothetical protein VIJ79_18095 [Acidobacteriaceae bacterium]